MTQMTADSIDFISVRYVQQSVHPYFSNSEMSIAETYVALASGLLDPASLSPIMIFKVDGNLYCINTRRLKIMKELQRRKKGHVLKHFLVRYVQEGDVDFMDQYWSFVDHRIPAMKDKNFDGTTTQLDFDSNYMCCFDQTGNFRDDLDKHMAEEHLNMPLWNFKHLNTYECHKCGQNAYIIAKKSQNNSRYSFFQRCACQELRLLGKMEKPWTEVTLSEFCNHFLKFQKRFGRSNDSYRAAMELFVIKKQLRDEMRHDVHLLTDNHGCQKRLKSQEYVLPFGILVLIAVCILSFFLVILNFIK